MTKNFQVEILRYLAQEERARKFFKMIDKKLFIETELKIIFNLLNKYVSKYSKQPTKIYLLEYYDKITQQVTQQTGTEKNIIFDYIEEIFVPMEIPNYIFLEDEILLYIKRRETGTAIKEFASKGKNSTEETIQGFSDKFRKIAGLSNNEEKEDRFCEPFFANADKFKIEHIKGEPTFIKGLNDMTGAGGLYPPQLIILIGTPKSFKTGFLLNFAMGYVEQGKKVYYVDTENGKTEIYIRLRQLILECQRHEVDTKEKRILFNEMKVFNDKQGGDIIAGYYPAHTGCVNDVYNDLEEIKKKYNGWVPDVIIYDYPDNMIANETYKRREKRINTQYVYFDIKELNNTLKCFSIGASQTNREAVGKSKIETTFIAEDYGKIANCDKIFSITANEEEEEVGLIVLRPLVQRVGVSGGNEKVYLQVDKSRQYIKEVTNEQALNMMYEAFNIKRNPNKNTEDNGGKKAPF